MGVLVTGTYATRIIRYSRTGVIPPLQEVTEDFLAPALSSLTNDEVALRRLLDFVCYDGQHPLEIKVSSTNGRITHPSIDCRVISQCIPQDLVMLAYANDDDAPRPTEGSPLPLYVDSPIMDLLTTAERLDLNGHIGSLERLRADMLVIDRACEYCGTYSLDPMHPNKNEATYEIPPILSHEDLQRFLSHKLTRTKTGGMRRLRVSAKYSFDRSASPSETMAGMALTIMPRLGGLHLPGMLVNKPLNLEAYPDVCLLHKQLTPDLYVPEANFVIEIQGKVHEGEKEQNEDMRRKHDYDALGIEAIFVNASEYASPVGIAGIGLEVAAALDRARGNDNQVNRVRRLLKDKVFQARQQLLFETLHTLRQ